MSLGITNLSPLKARNREGGSSLLEVLIAVMVLALAGAVLVGGMFMARVVSDRTTTRQAVMTQLSDVAQELTSMPFIACGTTNDVYPTPAPATSMSLPPVVLTVEVLNSETNRWQQCLSDAQSADKGVQKITISTVVNGTPVSQTVVKVRG